MFSSYSEEIHIYDEYLDLLPFFDFDGALNPFLYEHCSMLIEQCLSMHK